MILTFCKLFVADFTVFAKISTDHTGFRRLYHGGYRYGHRRSEENKTIIKWECTGTYHDSKGKSKRCTVFIRTKLIDGYEMLQAFKPKHLHRPPQIPKYK